ncbi:MAG: cold shock domain-containing protein [Candidatus Gracilibacteria bacterium]|nr:cold shock domain-containing protein [Candidatus Gracilibacteria bacterium]
MEGTIKNLNPKMFGFISQGNGKDIFFHKNDLNGVEFEDLNNGDSVTFDIGESPKGPKAVNIQLA